MKPKIVRENNTVKIKGVPTFTGWLKLPTFAGALEAALSVTDNPVTYEDILGLSGLAFRVRWFVGENGPTGCPCSPTGESPLVWTTIGKTTGWQLEEFMEDGWDNPRMQKIIPDIVKSIDAGRPVLAVDKNLDSAVIYGYTDQETFLVSTYYEPFIQCRVSGLGQTPALAIFLKEYVNPLFSEGFRTILKEAVTSWHKEKANIFPSEYLKSGKAALKAWISFLENFEELSTKEEPKKLIGYHIWNYQHLYEARKAAAAFLRKNAGVIPSGKQNLQDASVAYQKEADLLGSVFHPDTFWEGMLALRHAYFSRGWGDTPIDAWSYDVRKRLRQIMEQALELEESAVRLTESAVSKRL